jgi:hypothetical protein
MVVNRVGSRCLDVARRPTATGRVGAEQLGFAAAPTGFSVDWCGAGRGSLSRVRNAFLFSWVLRVFLKFLLILVRVYFVF